MELKNTIDKIINDNKLSISYSIKYNNKIINNNSNKIYPIHSISKLFTNILLVLLYNDNIINDIELNMPLQLDKIIFKKLSKNIKDRLKKVSLLQCIKHQAGLKDYLNKYHKELQNCYDKNINYPNPIEPEDFLIYIDKDILNDDEIGEYNYNNASILLASLSLKYHYNKKNDTNLSYNEILQKYIINKIKLKSFSISKPNYNSMYPIDNNDLTKYVNGSPSSSYWLSCNDLCKFGSWINDLFNTNDKIKKCIKKNKLDIYWKTPLRLAHCGYLQTSSACLETHLNKNITISVSSNIDAQSQFLMKKIRKLF